MLVARLDFKDRGLGSLVLEHADVALANADVLALHGAVVVEVLLEVLGAGGSHRLVKPRQVDAQG